MHTLVYIEAAVLLWTHNLKLGAGEGGKMNEMNLEISFPQDKHFQLNVRVT